jgi:transposase
MPIKTGTWRRDLAGLEQRRLEAARMFAHGASQAEVARTLGVSAQAASVWYRRWRQGGGRGGIGQGTRGVRVRHRPVDPWPHRAGHRAAHRGALPPGHVWRLLRRLGWSPQRPARRAAEGDEAEIARWRAEQWPRVKGGR